MNSNRKVVWILAVLTVLAGGFLSADLESWIPLIAGVGFAGIVLAWG